MPSASRSCSRGVTRLDTAGGRNTFGVPTCSSLKSFGSRCAVDESTCNQGFLGLVQGNTKKFYEVAIFSKTYNVIPKRIVYYSIGSHSAQVVLRYLQKLQHKFFSFNVIKQLLLISDSIGFSLVTCRF